MDKKLLHEKLKRWRESGTREERMKRYLTPEKLAQLAYNSSVIEGVKCSYDNLLEHAKKLLAEREGVEECSG